MYLCQTVMIMNNGMEKSVCAKQDARETKNPKIVRKLKSLSLSAHTTVISMV